MKNIITTEKSKLKITNGKEIAMIWQRLVYET